MHFPPKSPVAGQHPSDDRRGRLFLLVRHPTRFLAACRWIIVVEKSRGCKHCEASKAVQTFAANQKRRRTITKVCAAGEMMTKPNSPSPTSGKPNSGMTKRKLRSSEWFNDPHNPGMTALYLE